MYRDLKKFAIEQNLEIDPEEKDNPLSLFDDICSDINSKFVLIVDEYDSQLSNNIENEEEFNKYRDFLFDFFSTTKSYKDKFRFIFITGVLRFSNTSLFSGFNNFVDLSLMQKYSSLVGFSEEEIDEYFYPFLENAANNL